MECFPESVWWMHWFISIWETDHWKKKWPAVCCVQVIEAFKSTVSRSRQKREILQHSQTGSSSIHSTRQQQARLHRGSSAGSKQWSGIVCISYSRNAHLQRRLKSKVVSRSDNCNTNQAQGWCRATVVTAVHAHETELVSKALLHGAKERISLTTNKSLGRTRARPLSHLFTTALHPARLS